MKNIWLYILVSAGVSYLIRVTPLVLIRREITNRTLRSFLYYVPYVTLAVMTFPAIVEATRSPAAGALALIAGAVVTWSLRRFGEQGTRGAIIALAIQLAGMVLATAVLYAFGTAWYCFQAGAPLDKALAACVFPFIPFDLLKIAAALIVGMPVRRGLERAKLL